MRLFDWIPTVSEVVDKVVCTFSDHEWSDWVEYNDITKPERRCYKRYCVNCEKIEYTP